MNILVTDFYLSYEWHMKYLYKEKFNFFVFNKKDAKKYKLNHVKGWNIKKICKDNKIDLILAVECSINNFIYKPFSKVAKDLNIPFVSLFDGIIDHPYANTERNFLSKAFFACKEMTKSYFIKYNLLSSRTLGPFGHLKYMWYNTKPEKNRYIEDNVMNFINGDILFDMYPKLKKHKKRFKEIGLFQTDSLHKTKEKKELKNTITLIGQPWLEDNLMTKDEFNNFLDSIESFCKKNRKYDFWLRPHPRSNLNHFIKLKKLKNFRISKEGSLDDQIMKSEYIIGLFSSAIANSIWFGKKIIICTLNGKYSKSIYNNKLFFATNNLSGVDMKKVRSFYSRDYKKGFRNFYKSISYYENGSTAVKRATKALQNLGGNNGK